jgi:Na+-translocating ferredoxin:NAD+ oxidoreductase RnfD subunit
MPIIFPSKINRLIFLKEEEYILCKVGTEVSYTGRFVMFSVITNIYNKKTKGPTLMELFTATGKLNKFFLTTRDVRCVHHG